MATTPVPVYIKPLRKIVGIDTSGSSNGAASFVNGTLTSSVAEKDTVFIADAVVEEEHDDQTVITEQPVEQGAVISDHAYKLPARLDLKYGWSGGSPQNTSGGADPQAFLKSIYDKFLDLQKNRTICQIYTGKRKYDNMLIQGIGTTTDKETENILLLRIRFQEIIIAYTQAVTVPLASVQKVPQKTAAPINAGTVNLKSAPYYQGGS